jgi:RHS repeat-associated protein
MFHSPTLATGRLLRRSCALVVAMLCLIGGAITASAGGYRIMVCSHSHFGGYFQLPYNVTPVFTVEGELPDGIYNFAVTSMVRDSGNWAGGFVSVEIKNNQVLTTSPNTTLRPEIIGAPTPGNFGYGWTMTRKIDGELYIGTMPIAGSKVKAEAQRFIEWDRGDIPVEEFDALFYGNIPPIPLIWKISISAKACASCNVACPANFNHSDSGSGSTMGPDSHGWSPATSGPGGAAGSGGANNAGTGSGLEITAGLGTTTNGNSAGTVSLQTAELAAGFVSRGSLLVSANSGVEVIKDTNLVTGQLLSANILTDLVQVTANKLEIRQYAAGDKGTKNGSGFYVPTGPVLRTTVIENPLAGGQPDFSKVTVTKLGSEDSTTTYSFNATTFSWSASTDNGARQEFVTKQWNQDRTERTETYQIKNAQNVLVYEEQNTYRAYAWGEEKISRILGPSLPTNSQQRWTWDYYSDPAQTGKYARLKTNIDSTGFWETYDYDSTGREIKKVSQFVDAPLGTPEANSRVVTTTYSDVNPRRTVVETLLGFEVRREYETASGAITNFIRATVAGAAWNDDSNLVTSTEVVASGSFYGQPRKVRAADGTLTVYDYAMSGQDKVTTVSTGQPSADGNGVLSGTTTVSTVNPAGTKIAETVTDISSGLLVSWNTATTVDSTGRPTLIQYMGGTSEIFSYGCCGVDYKTDREGIATYYTYDADRRVLTESRAGITLIYAYDAAGRKLSTTRRGSDSTDIVLETNVYDIAGRVTSLTTPRGTATFDEIIDSNGHLLKSSALPDAGTKVETFAQDHSLLDVAGSGAHPIRYEYGVDAFGVFTKEIRVGALGETTEWIKRYVDLAGHESKVVFPDGAQTQKFYNNNGQLIKEVDPDAVTRLYSYNGRGEQEFSAVDINRNGIIDATGPDHVTQTTSEVATAHAVTVSRTSTIDLTETGPVTVSITENSADGWHSWETRFGLTTHRQAALTGTGARTETATAPDASYVVSQFEAGRLVSSTAFDTTGTQVRGTTYSYDGHGRVLRQTDARNGATGFTYDAADQIRTSKAPPAASGVPAQTTAYDYDGQGRVIQTSLPGDALVHHEYFPTGELKKQYGAQTYPVEYTYDTQGRIKTLHAGTGTTTWNYDSERGWLNEKLYDDANGPSYTYTSTGRLQTRRWARGVTSTYGYDNAGELSGVTYSDSTPTVTYIRDRQNRITNVTDAAGDHILTYGPADQLGSDTIAGGLLDGVALISGYDGFQRRNTLEYKQNGSAVVSQTYGYDGASRLASVGNGSVSAIYGYLPDSDLVGTVAFKNGAAPIMTATKSYDRLSRLTATSTATGSGTVVNSFRYDYNSLNQRTLVQLESGDYWRYSYDELGQVTSGEKHWSGGSSVVGQQFDYSFDNVGNRTTTRTNGRTATYAPNVLNQYTSRTVPGVVDIIGAAAPDAKVTVNNLPASRKDEYFYQTLVADNTGGPVHLAIDVIAAKNNIGPNGEDALAIKSGSVFLPQTPEALIYDPDGNLAQDGHWTYSWDGENRLIGVTAIGTAPAGAKKKLVFDYDYLGRRIQKRLYAWNQVAGSYAEEPSATLKFVYDDWNVLSEIDSLNTPVRHYLWGIDLSGTLNGAGGIGGLVNEVSVLSGGNWLPTYDGNGNVISLVNAADLAVVATYEYGPFGEVLHSTGAPAAENPFQFSTKHLDFDLGATNFGYRFYDAHNGRWLSRDPLAEVQGPNLYSFVGNNAINNVDPDGRLKLELTQLEGPKKEKCGKFFWRTGWLITSPPRSGGVVVQTVKQTKEISSPGNCNVEEPKIIHFQEAWRLPSNTRMRPTAELKEDQFSVPDHGCPSRGKVTIEADAVFYGSQDLPRDFQHYKVPEARFLEATYTVHPPGSFKGEVSNHVVRRLVIEWNCCNGKNDTETPGFGPPKKEKK